MFVKAYKICHRNEMKLFKNIPFYPRLAAGYSQMESLLVDIKLMPKYLDDSKYLLVVICKIINLVLAMPMNTWAVQVVAEVLIHRFI